MNHKHNSQGFDLKRPPDGFPYKSKISVGGNLVNMTIC